MNDNKVWARYGDYRAELTHRDKQCPKCGSTKKAFNVEALVKIGVSGSTKVKHNRKGKGTLIEMIGNRWKRSEDTELRNGVREDRIINREKDEYRHIFKDVETREIIHKEHESLSKHSEVR